MAWRTGWVMMPCFVASFFPSFFCACVVEVEVEVEQGEPAHSPEAAAAFDPLLVRERRRVWFFSPLFCPAPCSLLALALSPSHERRSNCPSSRQRGGLKRKERGGGERNEGAVGLFLSSVLPRRALSKREKKSRPETLRRQSLSLC